MPGRRGGPAREPPARDGHPLPRGCRRRAGLAQRAAHPPPTTRGRVAQKSARISHELSRNRHESAPTLRRRRTRSRSRQRRRKPSRDRNNSAAANHRWISHAIRTSQHRHESAPTLRGRSRPPQRLLRAQAQGQPADAVGQLAQWPLPRAGSRPVGWCGGVGVCGCVAVGEGVWAGRRRAGRARWGRLARCGGCRRRGWNTPRPQNPTPATSIDRTPSALTGGAAAPRRAALPYHLVPSRSFLAPSRLDVPRFPTSSG